MNTKLTPEQEEIVYSHPQGEHCVILACAGSGKSSCVAHRIKHLVMDNGNSSSILVLMFNAIARRQFVAHLDNIGLPENLQPPVHTFHSYSFRIINQMIKEGVLPVTTQFWLTDKTELIHLTIKRAISTLEKAGRIPPESVDPEDALRAIGLWKGMMTLPQNAGSTSVYLPLAFQEYENSSHGAKCNNL